MRARGSLAQPSGKTECELCRHKSRNRQVLHVLKFTNLDELKSHLAGVFGQPSYGAEFFLTLWNSANQLYGHIAREKYVPLWVVYFEAHGMKIIDRAEVIMRHRGRVQPEE